MVTSGYAQSGPLLWRINSISKASAAISRLSPFSVCGMMCAAATLEDGDVVMTGKERNSFYGARYRDALKKEMVAAYGGKCAICSEDNPFALCLDHINNDSHIERTYFSSTSRGGDKLYAKLKKEGWPKERLQLVCYNCNAIKEHRRRRADVVVEAKYADRTLVQARIGKQRNNVSGVKGAFWDRQKGKWTARIMSDYKQRHLGFFDDIADAAKAYRAAALALWGEDANVPTDAEINVAASRWREVEMPRPKRSLISCTSEADEADRQ